jgi:hypothetical protein
MVRPSVDAQTLGRRTDRGRQTDLRSTDRRRRLLAEFLAEFLAKILAEILGEILAKILAEIFGEILAEILAEIFGEILAKGVAEASLKASRMAWWGTDEDDRRSPPTMRGHDGTLDAAGTPPNAHERKECARRRHEHVEERPRAERATRPEAAAACEALRRRRRRLDSNPPLALALSRSRTTPPANRRRNDGGWRTRVETNACDEEGWRRAARSAREEVGRRRSGGSDHTMEHHLKGGSEGEVRVRFNYLT